MLARTFVEISERRLASQFSVRPSFLRGNNRKGMAKRFWGMKKKMKRGGQYME